MLDSVLFVESHQMYLGDIFLDPVCSVSDCIPSWTLIHADPLAYPIRFSLVGPFISMANIRVPTEYALLIKLIVVSFKSPLLSATVIKKLWQMNNKVTYLAIPHPVCCALFPIALSQFFKA